MLSPVTTSLPLVTRDGVKGSEYVGARVHT